MSLNKPSGSEEEYFAREEAAHRERAALEQARKMEAQEREELKKLHHMKCPKCGFDLQETLFRDINIDKCYHCHGIGFDEGELEKLTGNQQYDLFQSIVRIFKRSP